MRKILVLILVLTVVFVSLASANQFGFGYNNSGPTLRFKWDDSIVSELSAIVNYYNSAASTSNNVTLCISPINLTLYKGTLGEVAVGFRLMNTIIYSETVVNSVKVKKFTANNYGLDIMLPELEMNVPGVDGLKLIGSVGISSGWQYDNNGKLQSFNMGLYGISLASAGIVYYFNLGGGQAAKSGQAYNTPAPIAPVKDNTVK